MTALSSVPCESDGPVRPGVTADEGLLHACFAQSARRWPGRVAIDVPPGVDRPVRQTISYAELDRQSDVLAWSLGPHVVDEAIVAILAGRNSPLLYAAQLAVLKAGAAYACIDPMFPDAQLRDILADSGAVALMTDGPARERLRTVDGALPPVVDLADAICERPAQIDRPAVPHWLTPRTLAYVIYTSGTTGRPKGVMIEHGSIAHLVSADVVEFGLLPGDRVGQSSSAAYDSSVEETWLAFSAGATLVVMDDDTTRLGPDLVPWLRHERISVLCPPPTLLRATGCADPKTALPDLRLLYVGGEALPEDVASRWVPGRQLVNGYGPTEATVTAIRGPVAAGQAVSIGTPVGRVRAWVLNASGDALADGEHGELCLGGPALARGYRNEPGLTATKFPVHPRFGRIFKTGDLAHRDPDGRFFYHGRLDSLVKVRGFRIELEAIEARLAECPGVRQAACHVQGDGVLQALVAFVVPEDYGAPPPARDLRASLALVLPAYMVPSRIGILRELPTTVGGKLDRARLPAVDASMPSGEARVIVAPGSATEARIAAAFQHVLKPGAPVSIHDDFFADLGGDSLTAAMLVSRLREEQSTSSIATRDLYEAPTVAGLARRAVPDGDPDPQPEVPLTTPNAQVIMASLVQGLWLLFEVTVGASAAYLVAFQVLPWLVRSVGLAPLLLALPVLWFAARAGLTSVAIPLTVLAKRILIGRYQPAQAPAWGGFYVRHWIVQRVASLIPWDALAGTEFLNMALRSLGARVGQRVHIHRGVDLRRGGWDLLTIGDDVTLARDASIRLVDLERGRIVIGPITLGDRAMLDVHAGMGPHTSLGADGSLTPWSSISSAGHVPIGERWDGIPAAPAGRTPPPPSVHRDRPPLDPIVHAAALVAARSLLWCAIALPVQLFGFTCVLAMGLDHGWSLESAATGLWSIRGLSAVLATAAAAVAITLAVEAVAVRALGATPEGVISRWSGAYIRVWLKTSVLEAAGTWLSGTLFWPIWLRAAGMRIGPSGEISTIIDTVPDLVDIGAECFLADGIYLGGPRIDRGTVTLGRVRLGAGTFIGNHVVVPGGVSLPEGVLLGISTVVDVDRIQAGTAWFGHPPMELPRRAGSTDRSLTHDPSLVRYANRVFWELLRLVLPTAPILVGLVWIAGVAAAEASWTLPGLLLVAVPALTCAAAASLCALVLLLKWLLLGRARPGTHALWSCWCSRWDFLYVAWGLYARGFLAPLEGTLWLSWYLRAMGMTIGRRVLLGFGSSQVVDPDMIVIEDDATVSALFQAHTFEDRVLKIDRVRIRRGATVAAGVVPLYGADIGAGAYLLPHSVVMKGERLLPGMRYEGAPVRRQR